MGLTLALRVFGFMRRPAQSRRTRIMRRLMRSARSQTHLRRRKSKRRGIFRGRPIRQPLLYNLSRCRNAVLKQRLRSRNHCAQFDATFRRVYSSLPLPHKQAPMYPPREETSTPRRYNASHDSADIFLIRIPRRGFVEMRKLAAGGHNK